MKFRSERIETEYRGLVAGGNGWSPLLLAPVLLAAELIGQFEDPELTNLFRTPEEQVAICKAMNVPFYRSVHEYRRGADLKSRGLSAVQRAVVVDGINRSFRYGGNFKVGNWHVGTGEHFHIQVPLGAVWKVE